MKASLQEFFQLPAEKKRRFTQQEGRLEGYGQLFVVSEDQKLDWADMLFLYAQPPERRKTKFWPDQPVNFRYDCYVPELVLLLFNLITVKLCFFCSLLALLGGQIR